MGAKPDFHAEMDHLQDHLEDHLPEWASRNFDRLRQPQAVWVRVPAGLALAGGGVLSFLPVLSIWMLPVGLALLAVDVPPMQTPLARMLNFANRQIDKRKKRGSDKGTG